jgi:protein TonB
MEVRINARAGRPAITGGTEVRSNRFRPGSIRGRHVRMRALAAALLVHAMIATAVLLDWPSAAEPPLPAKPIEVSLVAAERPNPPEPPRPKPVSRPRLKPIAHVVPEPTPAAPEPQPVAVAPAAEPSAPVAAQVAAPQAPAPQPVVPEPVVKARFDADYLTNPKPPYPRQSRRLGEEGVVRLRVHVGTDGQVLEVEIKTGSGYPRLDQSALETVARWRFVPARRGTTPVASWVVVPIVFSLT